MKIRAFSIWLVLLSLPTTARTAEAQADEALLIGSSSVVGAVGRTLTTELSELGIRLERRHRSASGFARPDFFDWEAEIDSLGPLDRYRAVFILMGGNDTQSLRLRADEAPSRREVWVRWQDEARWREVYEARVTSTVNALCRAGAPRVIVLLPVDGGRAGWSRRIPRVRAGQAAGARASLCGHALDAGREGETFTSYDGVHLDRAGAARLWARLGERITELLGLRSAEG